MAHLKKTSTYQQFLVDFVKTFYVIMRAIPGFYLIHFCSFKTIIHLVPSAGIRTHNLSNMNLHP